MTYHHPSKNVSNISQAPLIRKHCVNDKESALLPTFENITPLSKQHHCSFIWIVRTNPARKKENEKSHIYPISHHYRKTKNVTSPYLSIKTTQVHTGPPLQYHHSSVPERPPSPGQRCKTIKNPPSFHDSRQHGPRLHPLPTHLTTEKHPPQKLPLRTAHFTGQLPEDFLTPNKPGITHILLRTLWQRRPAWPARDMRRMWREKR